MRRFSFAVLPVALAIGCDKHQSFGNVWNREGAVDAESAFVYGVVTNAETRELLDAADVTVGDVTTKSRRGLFVVRGVPRGRRLVKGRVPGFAPGTRPVDVPASGGVLIQLALLPYRATATFEAKAGGTVETGDGFRVTFPPCDSGVTGTVTASLATVNARDGCDLSALPGDFSTNGGEMLETFGAVAIDVRDENGDPVDPDCADAEVVIPAPEGAPDAVDQWRFDPDEGRWTRQGDGFDCTPDRAGIVTCRGDLPSGGWWNCDQPLRTTCLRACVVDEQDRAASGLEVIAQGRSYRGRTVAFTGEDGCACLDVMRSGAIAVTAIGPAGVAGPVEFITQDTEVACVDGGCEELPETLRVVRPPFQAFVTWGEAEEGSLTRHALPVSHLTGPCPKVEGDIARSIRSWFGRWILGEARAQNDRPAHCDGGASRFHICSQDRGDLFDVPYARVSTSYPGSQRENFCAPWQWRMTAITRFNEGHYRYSVRPGETDALFDDTLAGSGARVLVVLPTGMVREFSLPPAAAEADTWIIGDIVCDGDYCSWRSVDGLGPTEDPTTFAPEGEAPSCGGVLGDDPMLGDGP